MEAKNIAKPSGLFSMSILTIANALVVCSISLSKGPESLRHDRGAPRQCWLRVYTRLSWICIRCKQTHTKPDSEKERNTLTQVPLYKWEALGLQFWYNMPNLIHPHQDVWIQSQCLVHFTLCPLLLEPKSFLSASLDLTTYFVVCFELPWCTIATWL